MFVIFKIFNFSAFKSFLFFETIPLESQTIISSIQYNFNNFIIAVPAAQSPFTTIFKFSFFLSTIFKELINQAKQTIAVQCWSS